MTDGGAVEGGFYLMQKFFGGGVVGQKSYRSSSVTAVAAGCGLEYLIVADFEFVAHYGYGACEYGVAVGVRRIDRDAVLDAFRHYALNVVFARYAHQSFAKYYGMMAEYEVAILAEGLVDHLFGNVEGNKAAGDVAAVGKHLNAGVVVTFLILRRKHLF